MIVLPLFIGQAVAEDTGKKNEHPPREQNVNKNGQQ